jgi:glycosyltransferase XagB
MDPVAQLLLERGTITQEQYARAEQIQHASGGELGWIMASEGMISRLTLYKAVGEVHGLPLAQDIERLRAHIDVNLLLKMQISEILRYQFIPFSLEDGVLVIITSMPGSAEAQAFARERFGATRIGEILVTDLDLSAMVARSFRDEVIESAVMRNFERNPEQSARRVFTLTQLLLFGSFVVALVVWAFFNIRDALIFLLILFQVLFIVNAAFKLMLAGFGSRNEVEQPISAAEIAALDDADLPVYTVLVPVYHESEVIHLLIKALKKIDYPQHKLDVLLLLEEDDRETLEAAKLARPPANWRIITIPSRQPRTKPKACNYGLIFARGKYLVIYDAEDVPDADQLKCAVVAFQKNKRSYVCFQAALNYFNAYENFLTRMFTLEYSYWFDYLVPGLDVLGFPIPLGGTSNHFDVEKLRTLGGWDPFNTTEDADLGIRACVERYRVGFVNSTTFEEANANLGNWLRQRSRWIKGYMQTWLVFSRRPGTLIKAIGWKNFLAFQLFVGGTPAAQLAVMPLWLFFIVWMITRTQTMVQLFPDALLYLALGNFLIGNFLGIYLNMIAVYFRRNYALMPFALLNPIYWLLGSIASYKALWQLFVKPFYWEKTVHGISSFLPSGEERAA